VVGAVSPRASSADGRTGFLSLSPRPEAARPSVSPPFRLQELARRHQLGEVHLARNGITLYTLQGATAIAVGRGDPAAFARFDEAWAALSVDERAAARTVYLNQRTRPGRVTVALRNGSR